MLKSSKNVSPANSTEGDSKKKIQFYTPVKFMPKERNRYNFLYFPNFYCVVY